MAIAAARHGQKRRVVAVIGDGAMSAGMAFEALNHAGSLDVDLLVILNDNDMSISENVGAFSNYFARVLSGAVRDLREGSKKVLRPMPTVWELARRSEEHMKGMVLPGTMFEEMGFNYIGPIDGHDLNALVRDAEEPARPRRARSSCTSITRKGKGYAPAEADPIKWHGPGPFDPESGTIFKEKSPGPTYSQVFGQWLCDMAERDPHDRRHHARDARRLGAGRILQALSRSLLRRRDRRAARGDASRPAWPAKDCGRSSRSTRRSCSARTTS